MIGILSFLLGSKLGRYIAYAGLVLVSISLILTLFYSKGRKAERLQQTLWKYKALRKAVKMSADLHKLTPDERRKELEKWAGR